MGQPNLQFMFGAYEYTQITSLPLNQEQALLV